jgi:hypothetical protein
MLEKRAGLIPPFVEAAELPHPTEKRKRGI